MDAMDPPEVDRAVQVHPPLDDGIVGIHRIMDGNLAICGMERCRLLSEV